MLFRLYRLSILQLFTTVCFGFLCFFYSISLVTANIEQNIAILAHVIAVYYYTARQLQRNVL